MDIGCREVIGELSTFLDQGIGPELRQQIEEHLKTCCHCIAIHDGTRNVMRLAADERVFELPAGFSERLRQRLLRETSSKA